MATSPTQRTLAFYRKQGWTCAIVEHFNSFTKTRKDLFGFADILAMRPDHTPLLIQTTSASNFSARRKKILANENAKLSLESGFVIIVQSWRKPAKSRFWMEKHLEITLEDFEDV